MRYNEITWQHFHKAQSTLQYSILQKFHINFLHSVSQDAVMQNTNTPKTTTITNKYVKLPDGRNAHKF